MEGSYELEEVIEDAEPAPAPQPDPEPEAPSPEAMPAPAEEPSPSPSAQPRPDPQPAPRALPSPDPEPVAEAVWGSVVEPTLSTVSFTSVPTGAEVWVGGQKHGSTPSTVEIEFGTHQVEYRLEGYKTASKSIDVRSAKLTVPQTLDPMPKTGDVLVFFRGDPIYVSLSIDGLDVGPLPAKAEISEGPHTFVVATGAGQTLEIVQVVELKEGGGLTQVHLMP